MNETVALVVGGFMLCGWPLMWAVIGYILGKHGMPFAFAWRGFKGEDEDDLP